MILLAHILIAILIICKIYFQWCSCLRTHMSSLVAHAIIQKLSLCIVSIILDRILISNAMINYLVQFGCVGFVGRGPDEVLGTTRSWSTMF